jgi:hypothetical protein
MIQPEELYRRLHQQPFQPFRVYLKDGREFDVRHQDLARVGKTYFHIGVPVPGQVDPFCDYVETVDLVDIARVETLPATPAPVAD